MRECMLACVLACVCVCACVRACVCVCVCVCVSSERDKRITREAVPKAASRHNNGKRKKKEMQTQTYKPTSGEQFH
jgi:hypothetical protein